MTHVGHELEDAVSQAAADARISVDEMMHFAAAAAPRSRSSLRGHHLADDVAHAESMSVRPAPASPPLLSVARILAGRRENPYATHEDQNDLWEAEGISAADAIDFSRFGDDATADAQLLARMFSGHEAALSSFDHEAFAEFINSLGLRYFKPVELLFLGASNEPGGVCAGRNQLPARNLWPNIANTAKMLDEIRHRLGATIQILSGYRNDGYNSCVRGERGSLHKKFNAIDWTSNSGSVSSWRDIAHAVRASNRAFEGGVGYYPSKRFIHIDTRGYRADW
jgi:Peptidase M15